MCAPVFRVLRPDDARALAMLHAGAFDAPWSPADLRATLSAPSTFGLGLLDTDGTERIMSFVLFQRALEIAEMLTLATDPAYQRQSCARTLLKAAFAHLTERGITRCHLDVAADNAPALTLYTGLGFGRDGLRKAYYTRAAGNTVDAILMSSDMTGL